MDDTTKGAEDASDELPAERTGDMVHEPHPHVAELLDLHKEFLRKQIETNNKADSVMNDEMIARRREIDQLKAGKIDRVPELTRTALSSPLPSFGQLEGKYSRREMDQAAAKTGYEMADKTIKKIVEETRFLILANHELQELESVPQTNLSEELRCQKQAEFLDKLQNSATKIQSNAIRCCPLLDVDIGCLEVNKEALQDELKRISISYELIDTVSVAIHDLTQKGKFSKDVLVAIDVAVRAMVASIMNLPKLILQSADGDNAPNVIIKKMSRCRAWKTGCHRGVGCEFIHPSIRCTKQPNCDYGDRCFYIHDGETGAAAEAVLTRHLNNLMSENEKQQLYLRSLEHDTEKLRSNLLLVEALEDNDTASMRIVADLLRVEAAGYICVINRPNRQQMATVMDTMGSLDSKARIDDGKIGMSARKLWMEAPSSNTTDDIAEILRGAEPYGKATSMRSDATSDTEDVIRPFYPVSLGDRIDNAPCEQNRKQIGGRRDTAKTSTKTGIARINPLVKARASLIRNAMSSRKRPIEELPSTSAQPSAESGVTNVLQSVKRGGIFKTLDAARLDPEGRADDAQAAREIRTV